MGWSEDTGWVYDEVRAELHPIGSNSTIVQSEGFRSGIRKISGATQSAAVKSGIESIFLARSNVTLTDGYGATSTVRITKCQFVYQHDVTNLPNATYKFEIELMKR
jgi:hypothetical protein